MDKIKIAIVGVGNCASALIHGIHYYRKKKFGDATGLLNWEIGGYRPGEIEVVAAFDIDELKVGKDLNEAIFSRPNRTNAFHTYIPDAGISVQMGKILDGDSWVMKDDTDTERIFFDDHDGSTREKIVHLLKETGAEIMVNYLPVGSEDESNFYAYCALDAGVAFVNNTSVFIASNPLWALKFDYKNIPVIGDVFNNKFEIMATLNSACVAIDSIRCAKLALNRGVGGVLLAPSAYFCIHTLGRYTYDESFNMIEQFINDEEDSCVSKILV
jgi:Myo-inositol-1-phosphate synthase